MTDQSRPEQSGPAGEGTPPKPKSQQPIKKLPTSRINFVKQLNLIRAFGIEGQGGAPAKIEAVAKLAEMVATTAGMLNPFLIENHFIERTGAGEAAPASAVIDFARAYSWAPDTAATKLAPLIRQTWFGARMVTLLGFRSMAVDQMIAELAAEAAAGTDYRPEIALLVEYAVAAGVVRKDGSQLFLGEVGAETPAPPTSAPEPQHRDEAPPRTSPRPAVATGFASTQGGIQFHVDLKVDMAEMSGWAPERITAFFAGVAQVLAAKHRVEET